MHLEDAFHSSPHACVTAELNDLDFYSSNDITEIGSFYLRAAKSNGTVGLDNLTMVSEDITE